jgi:hypothetical protein
LCVDYAAGADHLVLPTGQAQQSYTINVIGTVTGAGGAIPQHSWTVTLTVQ